MYPQRLNEETVKILSDQWMRGERGVATPTVTMAISTTSAINKRTDSAIAAALLCNKMSKNA